jgi:2-dehydro-3-deoxyphosphogluconate aldolase/(4S)-4-hydroxy-2-oxoglutarate aldolase
VPEILLGAGIVISIDNIKAAKSAGAAFVVTPGFNPTVVQAAVDAELPIIPGINNPSGVEQAISFGLPVVKFFPAEPSGGVAFLKALSGPYPDMLYVPTGGINPTNLTNYLALKSVIACGGSWMVEPKYIREGRYDMITQLTADAVALTKKSN